MIGYNGNKSHLDVTKINELEISSREETTRVEETRTRIETDKSEPRGSV